MNTRINKLTHPHKLYYSAKHFSQFSQRPFYIKVNFIVLWRTFFWDPFFLCYHKRKKTWGPKIYLNMHYSVAERSINILIPELYEYQPFNVCTQGQLVHTKSRDTVLLRAQLIDNHKFQQQPDTVSIQSEWEMQENQL